MNFKKIIASVAAAALAVSAMAVNTFALTTETHRTDATLYIVSEKPEEEKPSWITNSGYTIADVYGVTYHVEFNADEVANPDTWIGGGIGANSNSTGWKSIEWGRSDKEITADLENGTITWLSDAPVFKDSDAYAQFWLQTWGGTVTVKSIDVLGKDGVVLSDETPDPVDEPAETADDAVEAADATAADDADEALDDTADEDVVADDVDVAADEDVVADADEDVVVTDDAAADEVVVDAPAADADTAAAATGNTSAAVIFSVMAVAGAAAIVAKKRK